MQPVKYFHVLSPGYPVGQRRAHAPRRNNGCHEEQGFERTGEGKDAHDTPKRQVGDVSTVTEPSGAAGERAESGTGSGLW